jgi:hypothetical protein
MSTHPDKTNNKHHYDVILSLRSGRRALCPSADYARAQWAYSELLSPTQRDKESRHAMLSVLILLAAASVLFGIIYLWGGEA